MKTNLLALAVTAVFCIMLMGCAATQPRAGWKEDFNRCNVLAVTSAWHIAAEWGMFDLYFDLMTDDAVFLGTDVSERWTKAEFMEYAREPFSDGHGWAYTPSESNVAFSDDRRTAWVDEQLAHEKYGMLRGTGVLVKVGDEWKIAHYSLTFLVPNEIAGEVVELIGGE